MKRVACWVGLWGAMLGGTLASAFVFAEGGAGREVPEPFARFEHMIGSWKGMGVPSANRLKGWAETHQWAWKFAKGNPVGMSLELKGDKALAKGQLSYDPADRQYRLEGVDASGKPVAFVGALDKAGKALVLNREGAQDGGKDRLTIRPNSNLIRYTMEFDHQEPGAPQYKRVVEVGLTKEGESFAAGGSASNLPKCILTGGAATMSVSYKGVSYPICCTGCRDEFNENPEKYAKKAALMAEQGGDKTPAKSASAAVGKDDGSFEGVVDEQAAKGRGQSQKSATPRSVAMPAESSAAAKSAPSAKEKDATKAVAQLRLGQNLEKSGKAAAALKYYRQVVKDYPGTPQAKVAAGRIKALEGE